MRTTSFTSKPPPDYLRTSSKSPLEVVTSKLNLLKSPLITSDQPPNYLLIASASRANLR